MLIGGFRELWRPAPANAEALELSRFELVPTTTRHPGATGESVPAEAKVVQGHDKASGGVNCAAAGAAEDV